MNKLRKLLITGLAVCAVSFTAAGLVACTNNETVYPDFKRTQGTTATFPDTDSYIVNVKTEGGQVVKGVMISLSKDGDSVTGISDERGQVRFNVPRDSYRVIVDRNSLPSGYYVAENGDNFVTDENTNSTTVVLSSSIITDKTPVPGMSYTSGDVLYDFTFTDTEGDTYSVSELLNDHGYNTIVLNWWYVDCYWCNEEFPDMKTAYSSEYSDKVAIICLSTRDTMPEVISYREKNGLPFFMCPDSYAGTQANYFNLMGAPTTVFVDRYGVICERYDGAIPDVSTWTGLFKKYSSDNYKQLIENNGNSNPGDPNISNTEWTKPSTEYINSIDYGDISQTMNAVINADGEVVGDWFGATGENDKINAWPFILKSENSEYFITASNSNIYESYAIINTTVSLKAGDMLSVEYRLKNIHSGYDTFYAMVAGETESLQTTGETDGWTTAKIYQAERDTTITVNFLYISHFVSDNRDDEVSIKGFSIINIADTDCDYPYDVATEPDADGNYTKFADIEKANDGLYHVYSTENGERKDNGLLFTRINQRNAWTERLFGHDLFNTADGERVVIPTLYNIAYWDMSNWAKQQSEGDNFRLTMDFGLGSRSNRIISDTLIDSYYLDGYVVDDHLIPVNDDIKDLLVAFVNRYHELNGTQSYEDEWLELCMYYKHYGKPHEGGDSACLSFTNKAIGESRAFAIDMGTRTSMTVQMLYQRPLGFYEKYVSYTVPQSGIYRVSASGATLNLYLDGAAANTLNGGSIRGLSGGTYIYAEKDQVICFYLQGSAVGSATASVQFTNQPYMEIYSPVGQGWTENGTYGTAVDLNILNGVWRQINSDGSWGSEIYIDFTTSTDYYEHGATLYQAVSNRQFDLVTFGGDDDYTNIMMEYYNKSIEGKNRNDADYGLVEATEELVNILIEYIEVVGHQEASASGYWTVFAYYKTQYGG